MVSCNANGPACVTGLKRGRRRGIGGRGGEPIMFPEDGRGCGLWLRVRNWAERGERTQRLVVFVVVDYGSF